MRRDHSGSVAWSYGGAAFRAYCDCGWSEPASTETGAKALLRDHLHRSEGGDDVRPR